MIRATEQVALKIQIAKIRVDFLTFSAVLGITRTSSVLHSLARKFALRFSAALGIARTSSALHSLARKLAAARYSPIKQVCRLLRSPCTNVELVKIRATYKVAII